MEFKELNLDPRILESLEGVGYTSTTKIQEQAIPPILEGKDLIGCAQTGTGKTAAYVLPIIQHCVENRKEGINTLIISPTRELALQIDQHIEGLGYFVGVSSIPVYGGRNDGGQFELEKRGFKEGADIVIATPGRLIMHLNLGYVNFDNLQHFVLDEADRMLEMGFIDDIKKIESYLPAKRQNLLFSATMPPQIRKLAKNVLKDPVEVNVAISQPAEKIAQAYFLLYDTQKIPLIKYLLTAKQINTVLIFASKKVLVKEIASNLEKLGFSVGAIHSDLEQTEREDVLRKFKNKKLNILVATDILSRGIDVEGIELVINYDIPHDSEDYIHRIGRTARAEKQGVAFTFVNEKDYSKFTSIAKNIHAGIKRAKLPPDLGEAPDPDKIKKPSFKKNGSNKKKDTRQKKRHKS